MIFEKFKISKNFKNQNFKKLLYSAQLEVSTNALKKYQPDPNYRLARTARTDRRTDRRTDGRTDGHDKFNISEFLKIPI